MRRLLLTFATIVLGVQAAEARMICTVVADATSGTILHEQGDCQSRVTPASTFKVPLAVMGYDAGFLTNETTPKLPYRKGYADWGGKNWTQDTTPERWMKYSVVWYSQEIARALGVAKMGAYLSGFDYGNRDLTGDPGKNNGLERSWISSSLKISPREQLAFMAKLVNRQLPVSRDALDRAIRIVEHAPVDGGWTIHGKTGSAYPRKADGNFDRTRGWGWYVGWARKGDDVLVFARLDQDEQRHKVTGGLRARDAIIKSWPALARQIGLR